MGIAVEDNMNTAVDMDGIRRKVEPRKRVVKDIEVCFARASQSDWEIRSRVLRPWTAVKSKGPWMYVSE
jgi:hypothetical protein